MIDYDLLKIGGLAAVATWGITQAVKPAIRRWAAASWKRTAIRLGALLIGAGWGFAMKSDAVGLAVGASGAALSAIVVAALKKRIAG